MWKVNRWERLRIDQGVNEASIKAARLALTVKNVKGDSRRANDAEVQSVGPAQGMITEDLDDTWQYNGQELRPSAPARSLARWSI